MTTSRDTIANALAEVRKSLLDLTRRNRLLNLRRGGRGALPILDEVPEFVWRRLVVEGKAMDFRAREEAEVPLPGDAPSTPDAAPAGDVAGPGASLTLAPFAVSAPTTQSDVGPAERHRDRWLQTDLPGERLQAQLLHLAREARLAQEEQGTNVLYLAIGAVTWREPGAVDVASKAPLLFVPVALARKDVHSRHALTMLDEEIVLNPCLLELAQRIFATRLELALPELESDLGPWLQAAERAVTAIEGLSFAPEIWVGLFAFSKLAMHEDLDPRRWPDPVSPVMHPLLALLLGATEPVPAAAPEADDPSALDAQPPERRFLVIDADSSQDLAITKALAGRSLVIEGPPGTGKSQTITNLIAELMAVGKTVLFVAEKAAALEVVERRLEAAGLSEFVLEMHSRTKSKRAVLDALEASALGETSAKAPDLGADELQRMRARLNEHVRAMHAPVGAALASAYQAIARAVGARDAPEASCEIRELVLWTNDELALARDGLHALDARLQRFADPASRPWRGSVLSSADLATRQRVSAACEALRQAAASFRAQAAPFAASCLADLTLERLAPDPGGPVDAEQILARRSVQARSWLRFLTPSWHRDGATLRLAAKPGADLSRDLLALEDLVRRQRERRELGQRLAAVRGPFERALGQFCSVLAGGAEAFFGTFFGYGRDDLTTEALESRLAPLAARLDELQDEVDLQAALAACSSTRLRPFVAWALSPSGSSARGQIARTFERHFWRLFADDALAQSSALRAFVGEDHDALLARFQATDRRFLELTRLRLIALLRSRRPDVSIEAGKQSKLGILKAEMRKRRRHLPLRRLFELAGDVIQRLKPCLLMSPISVARHLAPGVVSFDVVIFDEASQVTPADALGAIARGKQVILVGDEKQLPPTTFFSKLESEEAADADANGTPVAADLPSVLSLGFARFPREQQCMLRWHYRSRHQSLIEFSNASFYGGMLRTFPSPHASRDDLGLVFRPVANATYQRGLGQHNPVEAAAVAQAVLEHASTRRGKTLGVGAFSVAQQRAIEDEIERRLRENDDPEVERFLSGASEEPFFVKNLETIQGDERDVIFLSVGYGKDAHGKLAMNFGPLNQDGGWRRLNVLVTRARERCVLFSSIHASDLDLGKTEARGVAALKQYLHLAEHGSQIATSAPKADHDSPLEAAIADALRGLGHEVHAQVGSAGFSIDLAIVDPEQKGRYLVGIECDGATYRSSPTARDRDRLREDVLRRLGWTIVRVWSTDWYRRPERTLARVSAAIEAACRRRDAATPPPAAPAAESRQAAAAPDPAVPPASPESASPATAILECLRAQFGIRHDGLLRDAARRLGYERLGPKIRAELEETLERLLAERAVTRDTQGFLVLEKTDP